MAQKLKKTSFLSRLRNNFFAGAVVLIPIGITLYLSLFIIKVSSKILPKELNPNYSSSLTYVPREDRDEWNVVGLLGQIPMTKGQPTGSQWTKMKDISDTVELWFVK